MPGKIPLKVSRTGSGALPVQKAESKSTINILSMAYNLAEESLKQLKTDYVDILQIHNPQQLPDPDDENSVYAGLKLAQKKGKVRFIGISLHKFTGAKSVLRSNIYDILQYPLPALSSRKEINLTKIAEKNNIGKITMKPLCSGPLTDIELAFGFFVAV